MTESNARRHDNLGLDMPLTMVQTNINCESFITVTTDQTLTCLFNQDSISEQERFVRTENSNV